MSTATATNATATNASKTNASKTKGKTNASKTKSEKTKLSPLQKGIVDSLLAIVEQVKKTKLEGKDFEPSASLTLLQKGGKAHKVAAEALEKMERAAYEKEHGDLAETNRKTFRSLLNEGMRAVLIDNNLSTVRKTNSEGGERKDRVVLDDTQKNAMRKERAEGVQLSKLAEKYNVSNPTAFNICKGITPTATA